MLAFQTLCLLNGIYLLLYVWYQKKILHICFLDVAQNFYKQKPHEVVEQAKIETLFTMPMRKYIDSELTLQSEQDEKRLFQALVGRSIPMSLRRHLWRTKLFNIRHLERCEREIGVNVTSSFLTSAFESPAARLLSRSINQIFLTRLQEYNTQGISYI